MTMRITIEIVPFGEEEAKYTLSSIDVSNLGGALGYYAYSVKKINKNIDGSETEIVYPEVRHLRKDGYLELSRIVLDSIVAEDSNN